VVEAIVDDWQRGSLPADHKAVLGLTDAMLAGDAALDERLRAALEAHFSKAQVVELAAGIALFMGFSKIAIALGGIPDDMPVMRSPVPGT
jgi:alkylhydroperoxidase family enzyme